MVSAPLILGLDVTQQQTVQAVIDILTNKEYVAICMLSYDDAARSVGPRRASAAVHPSLAHRACSLPACLPAAGQSL
eukprot:SAG25_NODE_2770_length_1393_cov_1.479134_2_plen_77_part_00